MPASLLPPDADPNQRFLDEMSKYLAVAISDAKESGSATVKLHMLYAEALAILLDGTHPIAHQPDKYIEDAKVQLAEDIRRWITILQTIGYRLDNVVDLDETTS